MATLWLFGDEAGTMPKADTDKVFLAATIGFLGAPPQLMSSFNEDTMTAALRAAQALPAVAFVKPSHGFAKALDAKFTRMKTMALTTRLTTGANAKYLTPVGFSPSNMVWWYAVHQALLNAIVAAVERSRVDEIIVILDQKSFAAPTRKLFVDQVRRTPEDMLRVFRKALAKGLGSEQHIRRLALSQESIRVQWSDEPLGPEARDGLLLAHHLASHTFRDARRGRPPQFLAKLLESGLPCREIDVTPILIRPLADIDVRKWERGTGLGVPQ